MNKNIMNNKLAMSLMEVMIVLVIIAVIMAVSAPLIAHKMSASTKRPFFVSGSDINVAPGSNQSLNIGRGVVDTTKLVVNGKTNLNGNLLIRNHNDGNVKELLLTSEGIKNSGGKGLFTLNYDGNSSHAETNIKIPIPDYKRISNECTTTCKTPENGFVYVANALDTILIPATDTNTYFTGAQPVELTFQVKRTEDKITTFPILIPVSANVAVQCTNCRFIYLKNAITTVSE